MKKIALVLGLVLVSLPAMGQDKEPVKKPQAETVKKVSQQPDLDALRAKLKTAIAAGKITKEEAKAIYAKAAAGQGKSKDGTKSEKGGLAEAYEKVAQEVRAALKAGKITEQQAKEKLSAFKKQLAQKAPAKEGVKKPAATRPDLYQLFLLVEKGELTAEEAIKKYKMAGTKKEVPAKKELPSKP